MPHLLTALIIVATYAAPHRAPDELLESGLHDSVVRVWLGIRSVQGGKPGTDVPPTNYPLSYIGKRCGKSANAVSKALIELKAGGWIEEVGRDKKTPLLRCHAPPLGAAAGRRVTPVRNDDHACEESSSRLSGRFVTPVRNDDHASQEGCHYKESSCLDPGIDPENNNNTGERERGEERPLVLTETQAEHRRRLGALGVFDGPAQRIVSTMAPAWVLQVVRAGEHLQRRGKTRDLGAIVVAIADGKQPLPAIDPPTAVPRPVALPPAVEPEPTDEERAAGLAFAERAGLSVRAA